MAKVELPDFTPEQVAAFVKVLASVLARQIVAELKEVPAGPGRDEYLSVADAAKVAGVARATIRQWVAEGRLERFSAGRVLRVSREDLARFMRSVTREVVPETPEEAADRYLKHRRSVRTATAKVLTKHRKTFGKLSK